MSKKKYHPVLSSSERLYLQKRIDAAPRKTVLVKEHERAYYRLQENRDRRLARWGDLESALFRLLSDFDRSGLVSSVRPERQRIKEAVALLEDLESRL